MKDRRQQVRLQLHPDTVRAIEAHMVIKGCCFSAAAEQLIKQEVNRGQEELSSEPEVRTCTP